MMFPIEKYHLAGSVADAVQALGSDPEARLLAGGTDVLVRLHNGDAGYDRLVDIHHLDELREITIDDDGNIRIGALASCSDIIENELVREHLPMVAESLATIGGPQVRNCATMGGNICNGAVSADSACATLVYEFELVIEGLQGQRVESIHGFHTGPGRTSLRQGDVLTHFLVRRENYEGYSACYRKYAMRGAMDIATIGCGVGLKLDGERITSPKIAFTVAAPVPLRCLQAEAALVGRTLTEETLDVMAEALAAEVRPRESWRAGKAFREHIIQALARQGIRRAVENAGGTR